MRAKCWTTPTTYFERIGDAIEVLCGGNRPTDQMVLDYFNPELDSFELQEFCLKYSPIAWAQGIVLIDAAITLADDPAEGAGHKPKEEGDL